MVLTEAPDQIIAELWQDLLRQEGIPARLAGGDIASYLGPSPFPCRLLTLEDHAHRAAEALTDWGVVRDYSMR
ncbi:MAG: DUF2007 domain-containing protein [Chloroflexi bacterium]|nr:DUF2007 domain-containing protein [Chloroflexota bacterium]